MGIGSIIHNASSIEHGFVTNGLKDMHARKRWPCISRNPNMAGTLCTF